MKVYKPDDCSVPHNIKPHKALMPVTCIDSAVAYKLTSSHCPLPVRSRASSAIEIALKAVSNREIGSLGAYRQQVKRSLCSTDDSRRQEQKE